LLSPTAPCRDDPAIFAWDLLNEPRCDCFFNHQSGGRCSKQMDEWIGEMGAYVKVGAGAAACFGAPLAVPA
jgi:hypothetical protein